MSELSPAEQQKQELYRDARLEKKYDTIWQSVGKCAFCDLREKYIFFEEHGIVMTISLYAYIDGHFMIIPRRHVKSAKELTQREWDTVRKFTYIAKKLIREVHKVNGFQLIQKDGSAAQSTVEHLHFHCIPFDTPDLCQWNYRKLKHTPLENTKLYKQARKKIISSDLKFAKKYQHPDGLSVICDLIILSTDGKVLFQERSMDSKLVPDYITLPGGQVEDYDTDLESELQREVSEETGYLIDIARLKLVASRVDSVERVKTSKPLAARYTANSRFLRNTYLLTDVELDAIFVPGDDTDKIIWVTLDKIPTHSRISPSTKEIIKKAAL